MTVDVRSIGITRTGRSQLQASSISSLSETLLAQHSLVLHRVQGASRVDHSASDSQKFNGPLGDSELDAVKVGGVGSVPFLAKPNTTNYPEARERPRWRLFEWLAGLGPGFKSRNLPFEENMVWRKILSSVNGL